MNKRIRNDNKKINNNNDLKYNKKSKTNIDSKSLSPQDPYFNSIESSILNESDELFKTKFTKMFNDFNTKLLSNKKIVDKLKEKYEFALNELNKYLKKNIKKIFCYIGSNCNFTFFRNYILNNRYYEFLLIYYSDLYDKKYQKNINDLIILFFLSLTNRTKTTYMMMYIIYNCVENILNNEFKNMNFCKWINYFKINKINSENIFFYFLIYSPKIHDQFCNFIMQHLIIKRLNYLYHVLMTSPFDKNVSHRVLSLVLIARYKFEKKNNLETYNRYYPLLIEKYKDSIYEINLSEFLSKNFKNESCHVLMDYAVDKLIKSNPQQIDLKIKSFEKITFNFIKEKKIQINISEFSDYIFSTDICKNNMSKEKEI